MVLAEGRRRNALQKLHTVCICVGYNSIHAILRIGNVMTLARYRVGIDQVRTTVTLAPVLAEL
jgi:hypothetical protein